MAWRKTNIINGSEKSWVLLRREDRIPAWTCVELDGWTMQMSSIKCFLSVRSNFIAHGVRLITTRESTVSRRRANREIRWRAWTMVTSHSPLHGCNESSWLFNYRPIRFESAVLFFSGCDNSMSILLFRPLWRTSLSEEKSRFWPSEHSWTLSLHDCVTTWSISTTPVSGTLIETNDICKRVKMSIRRRNNIVFLLVIVIPRTIKT